MERVTIGGELKLNIGIEPVGQYTMDDYAFEVEVVSTGFIRKSVTIAKESCIRVDNGNYLVLVDTKMLGQGLLTCKVTAHIPDNDFEDGLRTEVAEVGTGIELIRGA